MHWPAKYFKPEEVLSPLGLLQYKQGNLMLCNHALANLDSFRDSLGSALYCNVASLKFRGYRAPAENNKIGGAPYSRHVQGIAFDVHSKKLKPRELFEKAKEFNWPCALLYPTFIHLDNRSLVGEPIYKVM